MTNAAEFKALDCEITGGIRKEPDSVGSSRNRVGLYVVANYSEIMKDICASHAKPNVLPDRDPKDVTDLIRLGPIVVRKLPVELVGGDLDCAALADLLRRRENIFDCTKASRYQRHYDDS